MSPRTDTERLDWLERWHESDIWDAAIVETTQGQFSGVNFCKSDATEFADSEHMGMTLRDAIDQAMDAEEVG